MKTFIAKTTLFVAIFMAIFGLSVQKAEAAAPVLTLSNAGNSQVRIEVQGDINTSVQLYFYNPPNSGTIQSAGVIGSTNSSGYFSTVVNSNSYGIPTGTSVFVNVNNQQSSSVTWPTITGGNIYLSQTNIWLSVNQSNTVSISGGTGTYYISTNSNSNVANASINGSILSVTGVNGGSTNISICSASAGTSCATLFVTVSGGNNNQSISFNPSSVSVQVGQNQSVSIYGSGSYYLSNNSNSSVASATINGNSLNVYGIINGSTTMTICSQSSNSTCATLYVTVYSSYNNGNNNNNNNYCNYYNNYCNNNNYNNYNNYQNPPIVYTQPVVYTQPTVVQQTYGQPVTGVYLNQIPSTGMSFSLKVMLFVLGLFLWSTALAYIMSTSRTNMLSGNVSVTNGSLSKAERFKLNQMQKRGK